MPHYSAAGMPACSLHQVCWGGVGAGREGVHGGLLEGPLPACPCSRCVSSGGGKVECDLLVWGLDASQWEQTLLLAHYNAALHAACTSVRFQGGGGAGGAAGKGDVAGMWDALLRGLPHCGGTD